MRKLFLLGAIGMCFVTTSQAQQKFNVQNGTKTEFYDDLETAIEKSVSGDTLYLPGIVVNVANDLIIDKRLTIIGAGCDVDSIGGLQTTEIKRDYNYYANINFRNGANGSLITGCVLASITLGHRNEFNEPLQDIENITITRNHINGAISLGIDVANNKSKKIIISQNRIDGQLNGSNATECFIQNNAIKTTNNSIVYLQNSYITNNVLPIISSMKSCTVENNYCYDNSYIGSSTNCVFNNNAFLGAVSFPNGTNSGSNNLINQEFIKTFTGTTYYPNQIMIRDTSPCKNAGTDGTDIGIYGGAAPYKAGAVPFNPHIDKATISTQTDKDGNLKVNIQVSAQAE